MNTASRFESSAHRVVVTGGSGRLGRKVIEELSSDRYEVLSVDIVPSEECPAKFLCVDLTDAEAVSDALAGADSVIHLGAVPGPRNQAESDTFRNNVLSTWNVAEAAVTHDLQRIVFASTVFTLGWHEDAEVLQPEYLPVDEAHPMTPFEAYGLSKVVGEEIIASACRRSGIPAVSLRIMNVIQTEGYDALPWPTPTPDSPVRFVHWPYVDVRDAAISCRQALEASTTGHEAMFIAAQDIRFDASTESLVPQFFPNATIRSPLPGMSSVISIEKARRLIGFNPEFSWQNHRP